MREKRVIIITINFITNPSKIIVLLSLFFIDTLLKVCWYLQGRALSEESAKELLRHESLWESSPVPPLQQLALDQPLANYDTLLLLSQCSRALHLLTIFSLRTTRPITAFFDSIVRAVLDLHLSIAVFHSTKLQNEHLCWGHFHWDIQTWLKSK